MTTASNTAVGGPLNILGVDVYDDLVRKSRQVDWHGKGRIDKFMLFSKSGFTDAMLDRAKKEDVLLIHKDTVLA